MTRRRRGTNTGIPGLSFSLNRALGVTNAKRKFAKATGIPTTRSGRQRKIGKMVTGGGCLLPILIVLVCLIAMF
jgi:hypothetical protein